jgi:hypothetical protein
MRVDAPLDAALKFRGRALGEGEREIRSSC